MALSRLDIKRTLHRGLAQTLNAAYAVYSYAQRDRIRTQMAQRPRGYVLSPEKVLEQTVFRVAPTLVHVIREFTGVEHSSEFMKRVIVEGVAEHLFDNYGEAIYINPNRIETLMEIIGIPAERKNEFIAEAKKHYLIYEALYAAGQTPAIFASRPRGTPRGNYIERSFTVPTRDGIPLKFTRIVNVEEVKTNDRQPSLVFLPGIACDNKTFDLSDQDSPALDFADHKNWVYLFDPRGLGKNRGEFDPYCYLDTLISNDFPAVLSFIFNRPKVPKPAIIVAHSMGGMVSEFMLVRQAYKLQEALSALCHLTSRPNISIIGKTRKETEAALMEIESTLGERDHAPEITANLEEAKSCLSHLNAVKGLITLGSPKIFDKNYHAIYPLLMMLNFILPILGSDRVPVDKAKWITTALPALLRLVKILIVSENFSNPNKFVRDFVRQGTEDFPLGVGLQLLKAVYSGKGIRRMAQDKFNYSAHLNLVPVDISMAHIVGTEDILCPAFNMAFIDRAGYASPHLDFSGLPEYSHPHKNVTRLSRIAKITHVPIPEQGGFVQGYLVDRVGHLDYLYGERAETLVKPLIHKLIQQMWAENTPQ